MESAKYIGRVGTLAVALGIGAALTTGTGIAYADDSSGGGSNSSGSSSSSSSSGSDSKSSTGSSTTSKTSSSDDSATTPRKRPLSRLGDRVRKQAERSADRAGSALERTQSRMERAQSRLSDRQATLRSKVDDAVSEAGKNLAEATTDPARRPLANLRPRPSTPEVPEAPAASGGTDTPEAPAALRRSADRSNAEQISPAALGDLPTLRQRERATTVTLKLKEAGDTVAQRALAAIATPPDALTSGLSRNLPTGPVTAFADRVVATATPSPDLPEAPELSGGSIASALLVAAGLAPLGAGTSPLVPGPSAALWALAAAARREPEKVVNPEGVALKSANDAVSPTAATGEVELLASTAAPGTVVIGPGQTDAPVIDGSTSSTQTGWTTGNGSGFGVTDKWFVGGTDLGIMWDSGLRDAEGKPVIFTMFGDTYDVADPASNIGWRDNVLLRALDLNLNDGLQFDDALIHDGGDPNRPMWWRPTPTLDRAGAAQIIDPAAIDALKGTNTYTLIPTSAIAGNPVLDQDGNAVLDDDGNPLVTQYATVMSIKQWGQAGSWTTNWSAIAVSEDNGKSWNIDPATVRMSTGGDTNFQQNAMVYGNAEDATSYVDGDLDGERYVYVYGTPSGRQGSAYVARVPESQFTNLAAYEYFAGDNGEGEGKWVVGTPSQAVAVIGTEGATGSIFPETGLLGIVFKPLVSFLKFVYPAGFKPGGIFSAGGSGGNVSEMSVQYNENLDKYVVLYTDGGNNVVMRVSDSPQGTWSNATVLQANQGYGQNTGMYGPMIHPLSGTGQLENDNDGSYLYYNLSQWNDYNVRMMRADLSRLTIT